MVVVFFGVDEQNFVRLWFLIRNIVNVEDDQRRRSFFLLIKHGTSCERGHSHGRRRCCFKELMQRALFQYLLWGAYFIFFGYHFSSEKKGILKKKSTKKIFGRPLAGQNFSVTATSQLHTPPVVLQAGPLGVEVPTLAAHSAAMQRDYSEWDVVNESSGVDES